MKKDLIIFVFYQQGYKRIVLDDIIALIAARSYCDILTANSGTLTVSTPLCKVFSKIAHPDLVQIHRSHVINISHINSLMGNMVCMTNGEKLAISREYQKEFFERFVFIGAKGR